MFLSIKGIIKNNSQNLYRFNRVHSVLFRKNSSLVDDFSPSQSNFNVYSHNFNILKDPIEHDTTLPSFMVGYENGFLPRQDPLAKLPYRFYALENLLQNMPIHLPDGREGLLANGQLGDAVKRDLPQFDVSDITDQRLLSGREKKDYGLGREILPKNIAIPLNIVANKLNAFPFMEYARSHSLYNYQRIDPTKPIVYPNLKLVRAFAGTAPERGFILVHVSMVARSGNLIKCTMETLEATQEKDRVKFNNALKNLIDTMNSINQEMETMWERSNSEDYLKFRTFIMGSKNQPMFPNGVIYEGVSEKPLFYRGESGATDSMIPCMDNLLQITSKLPNNPLTEVLKDFRKYRPANHKEFLDFVQRRAEEVNVRGFAIQDANSTALYLANMDQIRAFRHRHWNFTKEYVIKNSKHPVATGGSPIVTWLPNQLGTILDQMNKIGQTIDYNKLTPENKIIIDEIINKVDAQERVLKREVKFLKQQFGSSQDRVVI
ncbi:IDO-domain-containing protein [Rhizophagus irregularis]|uniref:IDO-domain-containing protein n=1 Tax=Rhizophagus irregularis TaxID=588596 RepID=A0A2I1GJF7_9GLOM|nr:IDO-domain-containing protein [Rhizophagus irregularis]